MNDNAPEFSTSSYIFYVSYYAQAGTYVGKVTATDADVGHYGIVSYSLDQSEYFAINSFGEITVKATPCGSVMGYSKTVTLTSTASDVGGKSDTATVRIVVLGKRLLQITY